jgi:hypothetical protein
MKLERIEENDMEEILEKTPFKNYENLFNAIHSEKATLGITRIDSANISMVNHPKIMSIGMYVGLMISIVIIVFYCICFNNYFFLSSIPLLILIAFFSSNFNKIEIIAWFLLILSIILSLPLWLAFLSFSITQIYSYNKWWLKKVYKYAVIELSQNEDLFLSVWNKGGIFIEDCFGNRYDKYTLETKEENQVIGDNILNSKKFLTILNNELCNNNFIASVTLVKSCRNRRSCAVTI